jgi:hypothetical protein
MQKIKQQEDILQKLVSTMEDISTNNPKIEELTLKMELMTEYIQHKLDADIDEKIQKGINRYSKTEPRPSVIKIQILQATKYTPLSLEPLQHRTYVACATACSPSFITVGRRLVVRWQSCNADRYGRCAGRIICLSILYLTGTLSGSSYRQLLQMQCRGHLRISYSWTMTR